jgi:hypothetical protein
MKKQVTIILALVAVISFISVVVAAGYLMTAPASPNVTSSTPSPTPTVTPAPATLSTVTVNATTVKTTDTLVLSTTVSDHTAGIIVTFTAVTGSVNVGTATTDANGVATLTIQQPEGSTRYTATAVHP